MSDMVELRMSEERYYRLPHNVREWLHILAGVGRRAPGGVVVFELPERRVRELEKLLSAGDSERS